MRYTAIAFAAAAATALAKPHGHAHRHAAVAKRANAAVYVPGPVETVVIYELNGLSISEEEVRKGIANGTLSWGDDGTLSSSIVVAPTPAPTVDSVNVDDHHAAEEPESAEEPALPAPSSKPEQPESTAPADTESTLDHGHYNPVDDDGNCPDCDKEFPSGKLDCNKFPFGYGAIGVQSEGLGNWAGIQVPKNGKDYSVAKRGVESFLDIMTVPTGSCPEGNCCVAGGFCSYHCPQPYLKMAWPKPQGARKESVGGLFCNLNNKLEMPDGSLSKTLCARGSDRVKIKIQSKLSKPVSVCRTDYPGTEAETLPLTINPGETKEIANPDQGKYYTWDGKATSAQYYINNQGVEESRACTWGNGSGDEGNRAPVNLGTSVTPKGEGFTSLFQNAPTNPDAILNFAIQFTGDGVSALCSYHNGRYAGDLAPESQKGCTAGIKDGSTLTIVFTDS